MIAMNIRVCSAFSEELPALELNIDALLNGAYSPRSGSTLYID